MKSITIRQFAALSPFGQEAFNTLHTNLSFHDDQAKRLLITSTRAGEGKSFIVMNLLRCLAASGKRVVLVDADLRMSALAADYQLAYDQGPMLGLTHLLPGQMDMDAVLYSTNIENAYMIPAGQRVSNPYSLLCSNRFADLLMQLSQDFDHVLVDAPPIGAVIDAVEIAKACSGALLVVAYNRVQGNELLHARRQLEQSGCPILGTVLNMVEKDLYTKRSYCYKAYHEYFGADDGAAVQRRKKNRFK